MIGRFSDHMCLFTFLASVGVVESIHIVMLSNGKDGRS